MIFHVRHKKDTQGNLSLNWGWKTFQERKSIDRSAQWASIWFQSFFTKNSALCHKISPFHQILLSLSNSGENLSQIEVNWRFQLKYGRFYEGFHVELENLSNLHFKSLTLFSFPTTNHSERFLIKCLNSYVSKTF